MSVGASDKLIFTTKLKEERDYWVQRLSRPLGLSRPPFDFIRTVHKAQQTRSVPLSFSGEVYHKLSRLTGQSAFLRYVALMAALKICLYKYTGDPIVTVGSPAFRGSEGVNGIPNALAIVDELDDRWSFRQLLLKVRETLLEAYARQSYPFHRLVKDLGLTTARAERAHWPEACCPLFHVALVLESIHTELPDTEHDITIRLCEGLEGIEGHVQFNAGRFRPESMERFVAHYVTVLEAALRNYDVSISALEMLTPQERHQLLVEWNGPRTDYQSDLCIHHLIEAQAARTPDAVAVVVEKKWLTYGELNERANQVAYHLRQVGVGPDMVVGICVERSPAMIVGLLGILKAGGAYLPLDPAYPPEHLGDILADAQVPVLVTESPLKDRLPPHPARVVYLDQLAISHQPSAIGHLTSEVGPDNLAYVIYTSGSTGKPKGVMVQHRSLVSFTKTALADYALGPEDRVLQFATISFDASAEEIYPCLASGATLVLRTDGMLESIPVFLQRCQEHGITVLDLPTVYWHEITAMMDAGAVTLPPSVRLVIIGGERALSDRLAMWQKHISPNVRFINTYGPTEATVVATKWELDPALDPEVEDVPIGRAIGNVRVYLLDRCWRPVAIGVPGELYIGGVSVARGYLNRPELTAERFIPDPFSSQSGARLYRTGDLARYRPDGHLEFLGRADHQVKIRGFRIELEEIEIVLSRHPAVRDTVVVAREGVPGDKRLVAYVVPNQEWVGGGIGEGEREGDRESSPTPMRPHAYVVKELRRYLQEKLPEYMMPSLFVLLEALPLLPNGKVDRRALPAPDQTRLGLEKPYVPPRTPTEALLAGIWAEVLGVERVGVDDNFFELGGNSLRAVQLAWKMSAALNQDIPIRLLFLHPTVAALAQMLEQRSFVGELLEPGISQLMGQQDLSAQDSSTPSPAGRPLLPERRPFVSLVATRKFEIPPVEAAALSYLPNQILAQSGLKREDIIDGWLDQRPLVDTLLETSHGRIASIILPRFGVDLYADQEDIVQVVIQALEMAKQLGARTVSLTGLIPSATDYGRAILRAASGRVELPAITTGHATRVATVVMTVSRVLEESGRDLTQERVGFLGLGSVGLASLRLMLRCLPHPAEILLADVYGQLDALKAIQQELVKEFGFRGSVRALETQAAVPSEFYEATLIVGATNAPDILDVARLKPGTMVVDDSTPHCFAPGAAIRRFQEQEDILLTEGDVLRSPEPIRICQLIYSRSHAEQILQAAGKEALVTYNQWNITGCVLSSLLSARFADLPPTVGLVEDEACWQHYERLRQLGFQVADLRCGRFVLAKHAIENFRRRFGGTHRSSPGRFRELGKMGWLKGRPRQGGR